MQLQRVHGSISTRGGGAAVLGGIAILLRQAFAEKGQQVVGGVAASLAVPGRVWNRHALLQLCRQLEEMGPRDTMKRKGRMARFQGQDASAKSAATRSGSGSSTKRVSSWVTS